AKRLPRFACAEFFAHRNLVAVIIFLSETLYSSMCSALHDGTDNGKCAQYFFSHHTHKGRIVPVRFFIFESSTDWDRSIQTKYPEL
ncbi:hypothetical protein, partial [Treponema sp. Marseille-Q4523]|uniref:hypothetical protein n=1 Tax=Treponema sp. Marseille-Q4523 TaxID=2810610 RepID=UPI0019615A1A